MASTERFTSYPAYRESGVEWLGEIPAHWTCLSLAQVTRSRCDGPFGSGLKSQHYSVDGVRVIRLQNIGGSEFLNSDQVFVDESHADALGDHSVLQGDLLVAGLGDDAHPVGRACVAPEGLGRAMVKADCFRFRLDPKKIVPDFAAYQLSANALTASGYLATGSTRLRMNLSTTATRKIALPPVAEQHAIVNFLNRETAKFDAMVAKKERLIELLQEKRAALITGAVTKGIDTDTTMKDSGVEWLGEIPSNWETKRIADLADSLQTGPFGSQLHAEDYVTGEIPVINPANIVSGTLVPDLDRAVDNATAARLAHHKLLGGDILFARRGDVGRCGLVTNQQEGWLCGTGCLRMRPRPTSVESSFLLSLLSTERVGDWLGMESVGSTMQNLNTSIIGAIPLAIPGLAEQRHISAFLGRETGKIEALVAKVREAIDRLKELRTALISAAVTGGIDVRDAVP